MKERKDQMICCRELLPCVPFCLLTSEGKSIYNASVYIVTKLTMTRIVFR